MVQAGDLSKSPWSLDTFSGRAQYYAWITDPRLSFTSTKKLHSYKEIVEHYK